MTGVKAQMIPLISTIFHLIFWSNLIGMIPSSSTPTVELIITLTIAISLMIGIILIGYIGHKIKILAAFLPAGTPLG
jgi:F0F1-type ATP synthase membrane subunit a